MSVARPVGHLLAGKRRPLRSAQLRLVRQNHLATLLGWDRTRISHQLSSMETRGLVQRAKKVVQTVRHSRPVPDARPLNPLTNVGDGD